MSERSEETTARDPPATDDLLEETEQLLSGAEGGADLRDRDPQPTEPTTDRTVPDRASSPDRSSESATMTDKLSSYFSPKAFLGIALVVAVAVTGGSILLPLGGLLVGTLAATFLVGVMTSKRRYLEVGVAGAGVGSLATLVDNAMLAAVGSGTTVLALGGTLGFVAALVGYYFGRDLRDGLSREI